MSTTMSPIKVVHSETSYFVKRNEQQPIEVEQAEEEEEKKSCDDDTVLLYKTKFTTTIEHQQQQQQLHEQIKSSNNNNRTKMNEPTSNIVLINNSISSTSTTNTVKTNLDTDTTANNTITKYIVNIILSIFVWIGMILVPLLLSTQSSPLYYKIIFPSEWYDEFSTTTKTETETSSFSTLTNITTINNLTTNSTNDSYTLSVPTQIQKVKLLGLFLGILAVGIGQICTWIFIYMYTQLLITITKPISVQTKGITQYNYWVGLLTHISQPEGFTLLITYLSITWIYTLMPIQYYNFYGTIQYTKLLLCLVVQDCIQYCMHRIEHNFPTLLYKISHKPHHKFINPIIFNSFNGSIIDTICMILLPLYITTTYIITSCNVWTYMAFGSIYANWLTLIHCEYILPWDILLFYKMKFGTSSDHHVHHKYYKYNYGHLFMYWDILCGTYRNPISFGISSFNISSIVSNDVKAANKSNSNSSSINITNIDIHNKIE